MHRGTTPTLSFKFGDDVDLSSINALWITISNKLGSKIKEYSLDKVTILTDHHTINLKLSQEDTLYFGEGDLEIQIRIKKDDGSAYATNIVTTTMQRILKEGVI